MAVVFTPPGAAEPPAGAAYAPGSFILPSPDQALWDALIGRPTIAIPIPTTAVSRQIWSGQCLLDGWILRETTGLSPALVEFLDGNDTSGVVVGELSILAPAAGAQGVTDVDVDASSANAAAANNVTLPAAAGATTFITGFEITGDGATAGSVIAVTVTGVLGGTKTYFVTVPAGVGVAVTQLFIEYSRPIPASALNTAITVNVPSFGAGNTNAAVTAHGFQRTLAVSAANSAQVASGPGGLNLLLVKSGVFMRVIAGSVTGALWVKA